MKQKQEPAFKAYIIKAFKKKNLNIFVESTQRSFWDKNLSFAGTQH